MQQPGSQAGIEVLWRPCCPYCSRLQRDLARAGVSTVERNIWADPDVAALAREVTGGNEAVSTVLVGDRALVNPSVLELLAPVRADFPTTPAGCSALPLRCRMRRTPRRRDGG